MTKPISHERKTWLLERSKVVDRCIELAKSQMYSMQSGGAQRDDLQRAVMTFNGERAAIAIELRVLHELGVTE